MWHSSWTSSGSVFSLTCITHWHYLWNAFNVILMYNFRMETKNIWLFNTCQKKSLKSFFLYLQLDSSLSIWSMHAICHFTSNSFTEMWLCVCNDKNMSNGPMLNAKCEMWNDLLYTGKSNELERAQQVFHIYKSAFRIDCYKHAFP